MYEATISTPEPIRVKLIKLSDGTPFDTLAYNTSGLIVAAIKNSEASGSVFTGGNLETITTIGTYVTPTTSKCRFKLVDATNHKGLYELHLPADRFSTATKVYITISGVADLKEETLLVIITDPPTVEDVATEVLTQANAIETGVTLQGATRVIFAASGGKTDGMNTSTAHVRNKGDSKNVITATLDGNGNRTAVTLDMS